MPKKCRVCKSKFEPFNSMAVVCSIPCASKYGEMQRMEKERKAEKEFDAETRRRREAAKSLVTLCAELQTIVNLWARLEDIAEGYKCISCGERDITDAGHFYHAGSKYRTSRLRFNRLNLNGQCEHCNRYTGGGNALDYQEGYIARYGWERFEKLREAKLAADRGEEKPLTKDEVREMKKEYRAKIREIKRRTVAA